MGIKVGICGTGIFAQEFIPLFQAHPGVAQVVLCDLDAEKLRARADKFAIRKTCPSLDELCQSDVDAIAIFSQNWMHGPQAVQALRSGKHVYSAVPSAITMPEITALVETVKQTGKIYMLGETSYYYPATIYCRQRFQKGDFGRIVYGEGEYYHDLDHGGYQVLQARGGKDWKRTAGSPPMFYPTHSTSLMVSVTGAHMTHVSCLGWKDQHADGLYRRGVNQWDNEFSNESALFRLSDGSMARMNEFRRIGHPGAVRMSLHGTEGSYEEQVKHQIWVTKNFSAAEDLEELLCIRSVSGIPATAAQSSDPKAVHKGVSRIHPVGRLPKEYIGLENGHDGSHQFLVDDFINSCLTGELPPNHVWAAARYLVPGLIAHESALRGGELLEVPDFGDPPK
jgi:predicted dehydrogenase